MEEQQGDRAQVYARPAALVVALVLMALMLVVVLVRIRPTSALGMDAPLNVFSAGRAYALLEALVVEGRPHPAGSPLGSQVEARIVGMFQDLGYEVEIQETVACRPHSDVWVACAPVRNVLTRLPGQQERPAVMLVAHYDSVAAGPGAADDSSNVAAILEIARILKDEAPWRNPIIFLITDAEEVGLLGAQGFVDQHPWASDVAVAINLEARGTSGEGVMFETSEDNAWLINAYAEAVPRPSTSSLHFEIYRMLPNDTDLTVFKVAGMGGLNFAYIEQSAHYHTPLDSLDNLNLDSLQHQGDSVLAVTRELASRGLAAPPPGNASYADILRFAVVKWPASWTAPLALLALVLLLIVVAWLTIRGVVTAGSAGLGTLAALLCLLLTIGLGLALTALVRAVTGIEQPWHAYPLATRLAVWTGVLLVAGLVALPFGRWAGAWGLALGTWLLWAILATVLAFTLTGVAILFLLPLFLTVLLVGIVAFTGLHSSPLAREAAWLLPALLAAAIWYPFALVLEKAVSFDLSPAVTLPLALVACGLLPFYALPPGKARARTVLLGVSTAVVVLATVAAILVPPYSEFTPQAVNLVHHEDRDSGAVHETAIAELGDLPPSLEAILNREAVALFPWFGETYPVRTAQSTGEPAPALEVLREEMVGGGRIVEFALRSPRQAIEMNLLVPVADLESVTVGGYDLPVDPSTVDSDYYFLWCYGQACDGLPVEMTFRSQDPVEAQVIDVSMGLPPSSADLLQARPPTAVPIHGGDATMIMARESF
jgi:hypothetical protein